MEVAAMEIEMKTAMATATATATATEDPTPLDGATASTSTGVDASINADAEACPVCARHATAYSHFAQSDDAVPVVNPLDSGETPLTYQRTAQLKVFLSYGHDRFQQLAFHIKHALQLRGHQVWVDVEKLSPGIDWEQGIADALTWVKEAQQDGRVLLIMTPHALRRPDGYCLNEIARATTKSLSIFPVMVADSDPTPVIAMLPFFDLRDCVPTDSDALALDMHGYEWQQRMHEHAHSAAFKDKTRRLVAVLELFEKMSAYGVPAIAGVQNLGLFRAFDAVHHRDSRASSLRRLLTQSSSSESITSSQDASPPTPSGRQNTMDASPEGSYRNLLTGVKEDDDGDAMDRELGVDVVIVEDEDDDDKRGNTHYSDEVKNRILVTAAAPTVRYMFSFDDSCYLLARQLYEDLSVLGFAVYPPPPPPTDASDASSLQANVMGHEDALQWAAEEKNGKMILLITPESVGRPSGECLNDITAAMSAGMGFVPLMVRPCEIPLSICRIQWLDMSDVLFYRVDHDSSISLAATASINAVRYGVRREQLVTALRGNLDHEGQQARLFSLLAPFSFHLQISKLTHRFTGREWLFQALHAWLHDEEEEVEEEEHARPSYQLNDGLARACSTRQVFWVTGPIGSGKTSVAARLVQTVPEIAAFHLALAEDEQTQHARRCVLSLAYQLTTQIPAYAMFLQAGEPLEEVVPVSSVHALLMHLLVRPLNSIARPHAHKPVVILLDGLEHLATSSTSTMDAVNSLEGLGLGSAPSVTSSMRDGGGESRECLVTLLPSLISLLPSWVRVVLLSRDEVGIRTKLQDYAPPTIALAHYQQENEKDIQAYVEAALGLSCALPSHSGDTMASSDISMSSSPSVTDTGNTAVLRHRTPSMGALPLGSITNASRRELGRKITQQQAAMIAKRSEGLFLYAVNIVQSIEAGRLQGHDLESLPLGMGGYLRQFFGSHFDVATYKAKVRPVLEVLCAAYEPLTVNMLSAIFNWTTYERHEIGTSFSALFAVSRDGIIRTFHSSVLDWVQDIRAAGIFFADVVTGHERIGKWAALEYDAVVQRKQNDFVQLNFELEAASTDHTTKMHVYIVRHLCNHLMQACGTECVTLMGRFASDEQFQLARRLLSLRDQGLESFFHGDITRERSQQLLLRDPRPGSFLIRYSSRQKSYCASFIDRVDPVTHAPKFRHNLIYHLKSGAYSVVPPEQARESSSLVFPDLVSFVEEYQRKGMFKAAIARDSPLNRQISTTSG